MWFNKMNESPGYTRWFARFSRFARRDARPCVSTTPTITPTTTTPTMTTIIQYDR
jgi:hypothetical protein